MEIHTLREPDERSLLHEKADDAFDHLGTLVNRLDEDRGGRRLESRFEVAKLDHACELPFGAAQHLLRRARTTLGFGDIQPHGDLRFLTGALLRWRLPARPANTVR